ncbi:hypothetical protein F8388_015258 [Cannabis sativa]|uniref:aldehyde dehydrogenase (NAD(+)) n=1 Tax=Cannabis sativa TaxID=3483 RepID=A0A7J6EB32_CANSA|nr:hypothetical protein F8388_015258 [Cannabis sativa]
MAALKMSSLLFRSLRAASGSGLLSKGRIPLAVKAIGNYSTAAVTEELIQPSIGVDYTKLLINGKFVDSASGKTFPTFDPRTGDLIANVAEGDAEDINRAVSAARNAFDEGPWPKMTAYSHAPSSGAAVDIPSKRGCIAKIPERSCILLRFADLLEKHNDELAKLETWDNGKPYEQAAKIEVPMVVRLIRYYAGWVDKIHGLTAPADGQYHLQTLHEPIGVCGQIIPWNFPLLMLAWKLGPALACGNTVVLKTAEQTPLSAFYAVKLLHELAFTGSTVTGKTVLELAARSNLKPVTLELGGKSPFIVFDDADVDHAVELAHFALFFNQGQCCCAGSRTYVHENVYEEFVEKAKARAMKRVVGDPFKAGIEQGPQIDPEQFNKILNYIRSGKESGAKLETGGDKIGSKGYYIQPTVFSDVKDDMLIAKDEIFGPVQSILKFKDLDEVIKRANNSQYGLAAGVFTKNMDTANTLTRALRVGTVWINCFDVFDAAIPFGGYKMSGIGREKGIYSLNNYLQVKSVVTPLKNPAWL